MSLEFTCPRCGGHAFTAKPSPFRDQSKPFGPRKRSCDGCDFAWIERNDSLYFGEARDKVAP